MESTTTQTKKKGKDKSPLWTKADESNRKDVRARQLLRAAGQSPRPAWTEPISEQDVVLARRVAALARTVPVFPALLEGEKRWEEKWETSRKSLVATLGHFRRYGREKLPQLEKAAASVAGAAGYGDGDGDGGLVDPAPASASASASASVSRQTEDEAEEQQGDERRRLTGGLSGNEVEEAVTTSQGLSEMVELVLLPPLPPQQEQEQSRRNHKDLRREQEEGWQQPCSISSSNSNSNRRSTPPYIPYNNTTGSGFGVAATTTTAITKPSAEMRQETPQTRREKGRALELELDREMQQLADEMRSVDLEEKQRQAQAQAQAQAQVLEHEDQDDGRQAKRVVLRALRQVKLEMKRRERERESDREGK